jgi:hypothetical protein
MEALLLFDQDTFRPILQEVRPNSDFQPTLEMNAERARFLGTTAQGVYSFAADRIDLQRAWREDPLPPLPYTLVPARGLQPMVEWGRAAWIREAWREGGAVAPAAYAEWADALARLGSFMGGLEEGSSVSPSAWEAWAASFETAEHSLHWGTAGWTHPDFWPRVQAFLDREEPPDPVRAAVDLMHGVGSFDWEKASVAAEILVPRVARGETWLRATVLLDAAVLAHLKTGRVEAARRALESLVPRTGRASWNARNRLLTRWVEDAGEGSGWAVAPRAPADLTDDDPELPVSPADEARPDETRPRSP